jgi:hypothetical protein
MLFVILLLQLSVIAFALTGTLLHLGPPGRCHIMFVTLAWFIRARCARQSAWFLRCFPGALERAPANDTPACLRLLVVVASSASTWMIDHSSIVCLAACWPRSCCSLPPCPRPPAACPASTCSAAPCSCIPARCSLLLGPLDSLPTACLLCFAGPVPTMLLLSWFPYFCFC